VRYEIDLGHIAHSFEPGHRIRIDLTSSAYPHVAPIVPPISLDSILATHPGSKGESGCEMSRKRIIVA